MAWGISHADVYDYAARKQSLKHWEVELGLPYSELDISWDEPLPEEMWETVGAYCENDVRATEAVHDSRVEDYHAREILSELSGKPVNCSFRDACRSHCVRKRYV